MKGSERRRGRRRRIRAKREERKLTRRGLLWIILSVAAFVAGIAWSYGPLVELGLAGICLMGVASWGAKRNVEGLQVTRRMPVQVFAVRDFNMELGVESRRRRFGHFSLEIEDKLLPRYAERGMIVDFLGARAKAVLPLEMRLVRRGRVRGDTVVVRSSFPFGLVSATRRLDVPSETIVFPRPVVPDAVHAVNDPESLDEGAEATYEVDRTGDFRGIREFQPGDSLKAIHWAASARTARLMVREFDRPKPRRYSLVFHSFHKEGSLKWRENFDHALELLTGLLIHARASGIPVDLTASFFDWKRLEIEPRHSLTPVLRSLAVVRRQTHSKIDPVVSVLDELPGRHPVFVVSESSLDNWERLMPRLNRRLICLDTRRMRIDPIQSLLRWGDFVNQPEAAA